MTNEVVKKETPINCTVLTDATGTEWCNVKIPRTATNSYTFLLDPEFVKKLHDNPNYRLGHSPCSSLTLKLGRPMKYFAVVRNPTTRLVSLLKRLFERHYDYVNPIIPHDTMHNLADWAYQTFNKNCVLKDTTTPEHQFLLTTSYFKTQVFWLDEPNVTTFKYENLEIFNQWLTDTFQTDTSTIPHLGTIKTDHLSNLDFGDTEFITLAQYLFEEDYTTYNY